MENLEGTLEVLEAEKARKLDGLMQHFGSRCVTGCNALLTYVLYVYGMSVLKDRIARRCRRVIMGEAPRTVARSASNAGSD